MKVLVIGQGIAGSILAHTLDRAGAEVYISDDLARTAASGIAAGLINPVTGKRYAKSWQFELLYPFARQFYLDLEKTMGQQAWFDYPIVRLLGSTIEQNEWNIRVGRPEYEGFAEVQHHAGDWEGWVQQGFGYGYIHRAARVDFSAIRAFIQRYFRDKGRFWEKNIDYEAISQLLPEFDRILFCEGFFGENNPYFPNIQWKHAKGDALIVRLKGPKDIQSILKKQIALVPIGGDLFWAGANYYWEFEGTAPTPLGLSFNLEELHQMLACDVEVVEHLSAVRPVAKDRRPVIGWASDAPKIGIFNGLGSKGALLAPYWAAHFAGCVLEGTPVSSEVDVQRFGG
jgi:glycine oxidase